VSGYQDTFADNCAEIRKMICYGLRASKVRPEMMTGFANKEGLTTVLTVLK